MNRTRRAFIFPYLWCAGWVNFLAVLVQFAFPTAPPWFNDTALYNDEGILVQSANNEAGFERLDDLMGSKLFHSIYAGWLRKVGAWVGIIQILVVCNPTLTMEPLCSFACQVWCHALNARGLALHHFGLVWFGCLLVRSSLSPNFSITGL